MGEILQLAAEILESPTMLQIHEPDPTLLFLSLRLKNAHVCTEPFWQMQMPLKHQRTWKHTWKLGLAQPAQWNHLWAQLLSRYPYPSWAQLSYRQIRMNNIQQTELGQTVLPCREGLQSYPVWCKHVILTSFTARSSSTLKIVRFLVAVRAPQKIKLEHFSTVG